MEEKEEKSKKKLSKRELAYLFGKLAEERVSQYYLCRGFTVLERNWRMGKTEIDLIVRKDELIIMVEVKARGNNENDAIDAVSPDKRRRMVKAADSFLQQIEGDARYRFDVAACTGTIEDFRVEILEDAFIPTDLV